MYDASLMRELWCVDRTGDRVLLLAHPSKRGALVNDYTVRFTIT